MHTFSLLHRQNKQEGVALIGFILVLLVIVSLASMTAAKRTRLETKMVFNMQDKMRSFAAADSAARFGWEQVQNQIRISDVVDNDNTGYYVLSNKIPTTSKAGMDWIDINNVIGWPWQDASKRFTLDEQLGGNSNPMKLATTPQYVVGLHNATIRKGTSGYRCSPVSIIGASQGGAAHTRTLIELKTMPKSTCFREKVK